MPKIIQNLKERLIEETGRQISEGGFEAVNIRAIAKNCNVGTGTVYNYFSSKDALINAYILRDWDDQIEEIKSKSHDARSTACAIYQALSGFMKKYGPMFSRLGSDAKIIPHSYHLMLRSQLSEILESYCPDSFSAQFVAEALITWSVSGVDFNTLMNVVNKLI